MVIFVKNILNTLIILLVRHIFIPPMTKIYSDDNFPKKCRDILRHELELKWIELLQTPHPLGFNHNIYHEGDISRFTYFDGGFSLSY